MGPVVSKKWGFELSVSGTGGVRGEGTARRGALGVWLAFGVEWGWGLAVMLICVTFSWIGKWGCGKVFVVFGSLEYINPLALELDIYRLAHHLCKM